MTATKPTKPGEVVQRPTGMAALTQFSELVTQVPVAPEGDSMDIVARILEADTVEELAEDDGLPSSKDLAPFAPYIHAVTRRPSDHPSNTGFYLICDGALPNGEVVRFSAGGEQTVAVLAKLHQLGAYPIQVSFEKVTTKGGQTALNARPIPGTANGKRG
jgi:hypothetical protein